MPSTARRSLLATLGAAGATTLAGCSAFAGRPDDTPGTGPDGRSALDGVPVFLAGDTADLPEPPTVADSLAEARVALATPDADRGPLADAFRNGTTVAFASGVDPHSVGSGQSASVAEGPGDGEDAPAALASLLDAVGDDYHYGTETANGLPVGTVVATPRGDTAHTFQFVREGGWDDPVLDPLGWSLAPRLPDCRTFVPERLDDDQFSLVGTAWVAGRLPSGELYAARTAARRYRGAADVRLLRLRTTMHAAANGGYAVAEARRVADFPNDGEVSDWFPNSHERGGVQVANVSDPIEETFEVAFTPASDRARTALTGCCGATVDGEFGYDHRTTWEWARSGLFGADRRYGGGSGRGEWHVAR